MQVNFENKHIKTELAGATGFEAITELVGHLVSAGSLPADAAGAISLAIQERERSMSTGIGLGLAIPHAATPLIHEVIVAFGRSTRGIDFDSLDRQPVRLVVLVIVPAREREKHLSTLARISRLLHNRAVRAALENASDAEGIAAIPNGQVLIPA